MREHINLILPGGRKIVYTSLRENVRIHAGRSRKPSICPQFLQIAGIHRAAGFLWQHIRHLCASLRLCVCVCVDDTWIKLSLIVRAATNQTSRPAFCRAAPELQRQCKYLPCNRRSAIVRVCWRPAPYASGRRVRHGTEFVARTTPPPTATPTPKPRYSINQQAAAHTHTHLHYITNTMCAAQVH